jgi:hypothetical protein
MRLTCCAASWPRASRRESPEPPSQSTLTNVSVENQTGSATDLTMAQGESAILLDFCGKRRFPNSKTITMQWLVL